MSDSPSGSTNNTNTISDANKPAHSNINNIASTKPTQIPQLIKKSSIFGSSSSNNNNNNNNTHSSGPSVVRNPLQATKSGSSSIFIHKPNKDDIKKRPTNIPIYGSNGKVITKKKDENKELPEFKKEDDDFSKNEPSLPISKETEEDGKKDTVKDSSTPETSVKSGLDEILKDESSGKVTESEAPKEIEKKEQDENVKKKEEEEEHQPMSEDNTDAEEEPPVPTHKGRRLIRKMEYDDQIQRKRAKSTNSDDGNQHQESDLYVFKRKRSENASDSNNSRSSSPSRKRNFSAKDALGRTKLQKCCIKGKYELAEELIKAGADVNQPDHAGNTPLHEAALNGHYDIAKLLIENGANVNVQSGIDDLDTPLIDACANNSVDIIKLLLDNGADPTLVNSSRQNAMDSIDPDLEGSIELTKLIRNAMKNFENSQPLQQHPSLQRSDAWIDLTTKEGREEIYHRAADGDEGFVGNYLANGGKPHPKLLIFAARHGHSNVVSLLLAFGAKIEKGVEGESALMQTVGRGHFDTVQMLLNNGANPTRVNNNGTSVLDRAKDPNLINDQREIDLLEEAIKNYKKAPTTTTTKNNEDDIDETIRSHKRKQHGDDRQKDRKLKRKLELEQEALELMYSNTKKDVRFENESDIEERKKRKKDKQKERLKLERSISPRTAIEEGIMSSKESTPGLVPQSPPPPALRKKIDSPVSPAPKKVVVEASPPPPPTPVAPVLTPEEEEAKRQREIELQKQREQWEQHKKAQREAKAADIMRSIEENKKRREEEEKRLALKRKEEEEMAKKKAEEEKLQAERKLKEDQIQEEIERRKGIRAYYTPGLQNVKFSGIRTVDDALFYLPLNVVTLNDKDYVCDLQLILLLGLETFHDKYSNLLKVDISEDEKTKLWKFFYPIIGYDRHQQYTTDELEKLRIDGLLKFQTYRLSWISLEDVERILKEDQFKYLQKAIDIRWIVRIELGNDELTKISPPLNNNGTSEPKKLKESSIPFKFRGNKKFYDVINARKKKIF